MNDAILHADVQAFISANLTKDIPRLLFQKSPFPNVSTKELACQIEAKLKSRKKLPTWFSSENIYYANKLNISQTSSEQTAAYKASIVNGDSLADITAGFGVDTHAFGQKIKKVYHVEKNPKLTKIAKSNFDAMGIRNIEFISGDGIEFLTKTAQKFDCIYIDPSRRTDAKEKVYFLSDCEPDVTKHLDLLFSKSNKILIKTGPLLDLTIGTRQLAYVKEIHIIALKNEVKEVLWLLEYGFNEEPKIKAVNLINNQAAIFEFLLSEEKATIPTFSQPVNYLYEPNAALLKSGAFKLISSRFDLHKLHPHSHLYTSNELKDFPGRSFKIKKVINYNKKEVQQLGLTKANITARNFPDSVATIRKKLKLRDGGADYLFFTKNLEDKLIVISAISIL
jgi:protein-L-isoaspartate O-methyltransferase